MCHPRETEVVDVQVFLATLVKARKVSASVHKQSLSAVLFVYRKVLGTDWPWLNVLGAIVNVASLMHLPGGSANAALLLASAGLATAYAKQGIRVNAVSPGATLTERLDTGIATDARAANISKETALARMVERIPMGRIASPEEGGRRRGLPGLQPGQLHHRREHHDGRLAGAADLKQIKCRRDFPLVGASLLTMAAGQRASPQAKW
jgi:NAD(P)-dependent dehydrogenase (short-subunit alcohol dehydrogenase family)